MQGLVAHMQFYPSYVHLVSDMQFILPRFLVYRQVVNNYRLCYTVYMKDSEGRSFARSIQHKHKNEIKMKHDKFDVPGLYDEETGKPVKLSPLQHKFAVLYAKSGNAAQAAKKAGCTGKDDSLNRKGHQLLNQKGVRQAVAAFQKGMVMSAGLDEFEVINQVRDIVNKASTDKKYSDALKGLKMLGDYMDMWNADRMTDEELDQRKKNLALFASEDSSVDIEKFLGISDSTSKSTKD